MRNGDYCLFSTLQYLYLCLNYIQINLTVISNQPDLEQIDLGWKKPDHG